MTDLFKATFDTPEKYKMICNQLAKALKSPIKLPFYIAVSNELQYNRILNFIRFIIREEKSNKKCVSKYINKTKQMLITFVEKTEGNSSTNITLNRPEFIMTGVSRRFCSRHSHSRFQSRKADILSRSAPFINEIS